MRVNSGASVIRFVQIILIYSIFLSSGVNAQEFLPLPDVPISPGMNTPQATTNDNNSGSAAMDCVRVFTVAPKLFCSSCSTGGCAIPQCDTCPALNLGSVALPDKPTHDPGPTPGPNPGPPPKPGPGPKPPGPSGPTAKPAGGTTKPVARSSGDPGTDKQTCQDLANSARNCCNNPSSCSSSPTSQPSSQPANGMKQSCAQTNAANQQAASANQSAGAACFNKFTSCVDQCNSLADSNSGTSEASSMK